MSEPNFKTGDRVILSSVSERPYGVNPRSEGVITSTESEDEYLLVKFNEYGDSVPVHAVDLARSDAFDGYEYAMFHLRLDPYDPWRGPWPTRAQAQTMVDLWVEDGFNPDLLEIRRRPIGTWEKVD